MPNRPSVAVFGAGAVGCFLGGKLALAAERGETGPAVSLVGRPHVVEQIRETGLTVCEDGTKAVLHLPAATSAAELPPADLVVVTVRTFDLASALPDISALLGETGLLLAMQNGVGSEDILIDAVGPQRVLAGTTTVSVTMESPGVVRRNSRAGGVALATIGGGALPTWIVDVFQATGLPTVVVQDYRSLRWSKLLLNMLGAVTTAVLDADIAGVVANPALFRVEQLAFREATRVMDAQGIPTVSLPGYPVPLARLAMRLPRPFAQRLLAPRLIAARGGRPPTLRADMARGRTEVEYLNGSVVRTARELGLQAPVNAALTALAQQLAEHPEQRAAFRGRPDRLLAYLHSRGIPLPAVSLNDSIEE